MSLFEQLPHEDVDLITSYITDYGLEGDSPWPKQARASTKHVLREWDAQKGRLYSLLGGNFIISKEIEYKQPDSELNSLMHDVRRKHWEFLGNLRNIFNHWESWEDPRRTYSAAINDLTNANTLIHNEVDESLVNYLKDYKCDGIKLADGKTLAIQKGAKVIKILGKIAQSYGIEGFEAFRIDHSMALNRKKLTGKLCLSIHPLDFMTMSDNNSGWSSCMSWGEAGGYRLGTVEMMNSPNVIVAYLASDDNYRFYEGEWNSKKWRCLYVVEDYLIASVKGYPYQCDELNKIVLQWIGELANHNWNDVDFHLAEDDIIEFEPGYEFVGPCDNVTLNFETDKMYNDFGSTKHFCLMNSHTGEYKDTHNRIRINYSGAATCMWCGDYGEFTDEATVVCSNCIERYYCEACDEVIYGEPYEVDGMILCSCCYENCTEECEITNEIHLDNNMIDLYLCPCEVSTQQDIRRSALNQLRVEYEVWINYPRIWSEYFDDEPHELSSLWNTDYYVTPDMLTTKGAELFDYCFDEE